ncbi:MAG: SPOR domain-containing protein [Psychrobium sp.]
MFCLRSTPVKRKTLVATLVSATVLNGCTITNVADNERLSPEQIDASVKEWQAMQPEVKRLVAMEKEITELKSILLKLTDEPMSQQTMPQNEQSSSMSAPVTMAQPVMAEKSAAHSSQMSPKQDKQEKNATSQSSIAGQHAIQIGAYGSVKDLRRASKLFYQRFESLSETTRSYGELIGHGRNLYRLKVAPFSDKQQAMAQCEQLKAQKLGCLVTTLNSGAKLVNE